MKILIYTHEFPPFLGGLATTSYKLAYGIYRSGHDVTVLAPYYPELENNFNNEEVGFQIIRMNKLTRNHGVISPVKEIVGFYFLKKALSRYKPDTLILITREAHFAGGLLINFPNKVIARVAGYEAYRYLLGKKFYKRLLGKIMKRLYFNCYKIICPSEATRELLIKANIPKGKTQVIYNGINPKMILSEPSEVMIQKLRNKYLLGNNEKIILTVSRLVPGKGQDRTIRALAEVYKKFDNFKYIIVGDGYYESQLRLLVNKFGLDSKVIFVGPVEHDQIIHYYDLCDIFILANRLVGDNENIEGLPNVVLEAISRGKPVVSGIPGGAKEVVEHGNTGYIVDGDNVMDISDKILELLLNPSNAKEYGAKGKKNLNNCFTEQRMIEEYVALL